MDIMTNKALTMASSLELIKFLVDGGADVNLRHLSGDTLCIMLSQRAIVGQSVTFLDHGANVYAEIGMTKGDAPIWSALTCGQAEATRILFQRGSNPGLLVPSYLFIAAE